MQHKCTICGTIYNDGSEEILKGCNCGNRLFYFINDKKANKAENPENSDAGYSVELDDDEYSDMIDLDVEAVNILEYGKYEIDINALLSNSGLVYRFGEGKYGIDLADNLSRIKQRR